MTPCAMDTEEINRASKEPKARVIAKLVSKKLRRVIHNKMELYGEETKLYVRKACKNKQSFSPTRIMRG